MTAPTHHVLLVPGFFGFANLGALPYFARIETLIEARLHAKGLRARVQVVPTEPTASMRRRAATLADAIATQLPGDAPLHLVGHSTGGLDARLLAAPGVALPTSTDVEAIGRRIASITCIATPHRGTPLASLFAGPSGALLLQALSLATIYVFRHGRLPLSTMATLVRVFNRIVTLGKPSTSAVEQLHEQLWHDFGPESRAQLEAFFRRVHGDAGLVPQLTPDGMDLFNAAARPRASTRYASIVTRGRAPGLGSAWAAGLDAYAQATHALYTTLYAVAARTPPRHHGAATAELPSIGTDDDPITWRDNDGVVPTLSQPWGEVLALVRADHLDVVGHFADASTDPPHLDWLASGCEFRREAFEALWTKVAEHIERATMSAALELDSRPGPVIDAARHRAFMLRTVALIGPAAVLTVWGTRMLQAALGASLLGVVSVVLDLVCLAVVVVPGLMIRKARGLSDGDGNRLRCLSLTRGIYQDVRTLEIRDVEPGQGRRRPELPAVGARAHGDADDQR